MDQKADLHIHSVYSDGLFSPTQILQKACQKNISAISITDHDTIDVYYEFKPQCEYFGVELISGVELSVTHRNVEIHILGYFIDVANLELIEFLQARQKYRSERVGNIIARLNEQNIKIHYDEVCCKANHNSIGRPHIAAVLIEKGYVKTFAEAFTKFIGSSCYAYKKTIDITAADAIKIIHNANGVSILAHPGKFIPEHIVQELIQLGIDGIEIIHPSHYPNHVKHYKQLAEKSFLLTTGGSDYHGSKPNDEENFGKYYVSYQNISNIKNWLGTH